QPSHKIHSQQIRRNKQYSLPLHQRYREPGPSIPVQPSSNPVPRMLDTDRAAGANRQLRDPRSHFNNSSNDRDHRSIRGREETPQLADKNSRTTSDHRPSRTRVSVHQDL